MARSLTAIFIFVLLAGAAARAQEALVAYKSLSLEVALELARAGLAECRQRGFKVSKIADQLNAR